MDESLLKLLHEACGLELLRSEIALALLPVTVCTAEAGSDSLGECDLTALLMKIWGPKAVQ